MSAICFQRCKFRFVSIVGVQSSTLHLTEELCPSDTEAFYDFVHSINSEVTIALLNIREEATVNVCHGRKCLLRQVLLLPKIFDALRNHASHLMFVHAVKLRRHQAH